MEESSIAKLLFKKEISKVFIAVLYNSKVSIATIWMNGNNTVGKINFSFYWQNKQKGYTTVYSVCPGKFHLSEYVDFWLWLDLC